MQTQIWSAKAQMKSIEDNEPDRFWTGSDDKCLEDSENEQEDSDEEWRNFEITLKNG